MASGSKTLDLTVLLPAYNEEEAITSTVNELKAVLEKETYTWEILVVDDCSTDKTSELAKDLGVRVVKRLRQGGSGAARRTGILAARGEIICMMDTDGSYDPSTIPEMMTWFPEYDQVNGARHKEMGTLPVLRAPVKWVLKSFASYLAGVRIPDLNTGLKAFKRDLMRHYLWVIPDGFSCVTTMTLAFLCNDHTVKYVPTTYRKRIGQSKFHIFRDTGRYFLTIIRIIMYFKPLSVFLPLSVIFFSTAIIKSIFDYLSINRLQFSDVILFMIAGFVLLVGLLADLLVAAQRQRNFDRLVIDD